MSMVYKTVFRFVALGDSLTYGYQSQSFFAQGSNVFSYTGFLEVLLRKELEKRGLGYIEIILVNAGLPGDTVRGMLARLNGHIISLEPDYIIVWGGINDLYGFKKPDVVMDDLKRIYEGITAAGAEPIACTVTPVLGYDQITLRIVELNDLIRDYCKRQRILLVELFGATSDGQDRLREDYSDDGIHLNTSGYRRVSEAVGKVILELFLNML